MIYFSVKFKIITEIYFYFLNLLISHITNILMEGPSRKIQPRRTKYQLPPQNTIIKSGGAQLANKQNIFGSQIKLSDKTINAIKKSQNIFNNQLSQAREYLQKFGPKVQSIYELQIYRSYLKGQRYEHVLKQIQQQTRAAEKSIEKIKQESKNSCRNIIEENQRLQQLKLKYESIFNKEQSEFAKLSNDLNNLSNTNETLKNRIKKYLKMLGTQNEEIFNTVQKEIPRHAYHNQVCASQPNNENLPISQVINSSIYLTKHQFIEKDEQKDISVCSKQNKIKFQQTKNSSEIIKNSYLLPKINFKDMRLKNLNSSMQIYQSAIKKIEKLQFSIINSKKRKKKEFVSKPIINDQVFRKQKIKDKKNLAQQKLQLIKLFIIYLKGIQNRQNRIGIQNLCKVISYFQKQVKRKQEVLEKVKQLEQNK